MAAAGGNTNNVIIPDESKVIVLLGETGVGKTSFAKSICLFEKFVEFSEASLDFEAVLNNNESDRSRRKAVESDTKVCKIYNVKFGDQCYSIVDSPGIIGDTNGLEQDSINWKHIFTTLSSFRAIHSICVLLKQGDNRAHSWIQYCFRQILCNLPKTAALNNLCIVITYGHGAHFDIENTTTILKSSLTAGNFSQVSKQVNDGNTFCVDNQFIKYFEAVKSGNPTVHSELKERTVRVSWDVSRQEVLRLLKHTCNQVPVSSESLIELNIVQAYISGLSAPIFEITSSLVQNILSITKLTKTIQDMLEKRLDLESVASETIQTTRTIKADKPWYTCQTTRCKENFSPDGVQIQCKHLFPIDLGPIEYGTFIVLKTISPALPLTLYLLHLPPAIANLTQINCSDCFCSLGCHEASCTKTITETIQLRNEIVQGMMDNNKSQAEVLETELQKRQSELDQLETELDVVIKIQVKMMYYLKQISTMEFKKLNQEDLFMERLDGLMTMNSSDKDILKLLKKLRNKYVFIMNEVEKEKFRCSLQDIKAFKDELSSLPINGEIIASLLNTLPDF